MRRDLVAYSILRGNVVEIPDTEEALLTFEEVLLMLGNEYDFSDVSDKLNNKTKATVKYMVANTVYGEIQISFLLKNEGVDMPKLDTEDGVFAYVCNVSCPYDSEFGYVFFEKRNDGKYHRIG